MGSWSFHPLGAMRRLRFSSLVVGGLRFSPLGESLSFASPKESHQRKGDPASQPFGFPIWRALTGAPPPRPGKAHKTCLAADLEHGSAYSPSAHAKSAALTGDTPRTHAFAPLLCRREAQPAEGKRGGVSELRSRARFVCPARASSRPASVGEHRREAAGRYSRGGLLFGYFFLATQEKVTRPKAKSKAVALIPAPSNTTKHPANPQMRKAT
jgi:hypothetical protein